MGLQLLMAKKIQYFDTGFLSKQLLVYFFDGANASVILANILA